VPSRPKLLVNLSFPELAEKAATLPVQGVGLMRAEFLCLQAGRHPMTIIEEGGEAGFVDFIRQAMITVAHAFAPRPVTYRASDLKSNEYRELAGGERYEPVEANPMLGRRGVFRYLRDPEGFTLELRALSDARRAGAENLRLMLPFVRTVQELQAVRGMVESAGCYDQPGFELWAMAEVPATALIPEHFAAEVDGLSIGSNDLAQLVLGADRDSAELAERYTANDPAVLEAIRRIVTGAHTRATPVSICGDQPSRDPALIRELVSIGIDSISVVPSAVEETLALIDQLVPTVAG
jgi:phosphoenolpyruvate synthase/pyruvate phosphate dikinase